MITLLKEMLGWLWLWPQNSKSRAIENVFTDKKLLKKILRYSSRNDLKALRLVNSHWREVASEIIRLRGKTKLKILDSNKLEMFVDYWNEKWANLIHQEFTIILRHDYDPETLNSFWKTIAPVVTMLEISYYGPEDDQNIRSPIPIAKVVYPCLRTLGISLYNINQGYSLDTCKNIFGEILLNSFVSSISVKIIGDDRKIEISDIFTNSLRNWKNVHELETMKLNGLDMKDRHFDILSTIAELQLIFVSLNIPKFKDSNESGEGLVRFLESQESSLESLSIEDLTEVFDVKFPRLKNLTRLKIGKYQQSLTEGNATGIRLDYHEKLPALKSLNMLSMSSNRPIHFLPRADIPRVTSVKTIRMANENISHSDAISILQSFHNVRKVTIPLNNGALQAVCQTQPKLTKLGIYEMDTTSPSYLDEMLTGLNPDEISVLETVGENILDNLSLDFEHYNNNTEAGDIKFSIGCLKRLEKIWFEPKDVHYLSILRTVPSFAVFKILLLNMDSLRYVGMGTKLLVWMEDLPRDKPFSKTDFCSYMESSWQGSLFEPDMTELKRVQKICDLGCILALLLLINVLFFPQTTLSIYVNYLLIILQVILFLFLAGSIILKRK